VKSCVYFFYSNTSEAPYKKKKTTTKKIPSHLELQVTLKLLSEKHEVECIFATSHSQLRGALYQPGHRSKTGGSKSYTKDMGSLDVLQHLEAPELKTLSGQKW